ncbi:MAG TPA: hypothetical protein PKA30_10565, partial [Accumulibacter sp.]
MEKILRNAARKLDARSSIGDNSLIGSDVVSPCQAWEASFPHAGVSQGNAARGGRRQQCSSSPDVSSTLLLWCG